MRSLRGGRGLLLYSHMQEEPHSRTRLARFLPPAWCKRQRQNPVHCLWILINQSTYNNNDNDDSGLDFYCAFQGTQSRNDATEESCRRTIGLHLNIVKRSRENFKMMSIKSEVNSVCCKLGHLSLLFARAPDWLFTNFSWHNRARQSDLHWHIRAACCFDATCLMLISKQAA